MEHQPARVLVVTGIDDVSGCARVLAALRIDQPEAVVQTVEGLDAGVLAARENQFDCVLVSADAAETWDASLERIRPVIGHASLIALTGGDRPRAADDVLDPMRPSPTETGRVVRYAVTGSRARLSIHAATQQMSRLALQDPMTGVLNRRGLEQALVKLCAARDRGSAPIAVLIDCDDFKAINDGYGHAAGDAVLKAVANALTETVRAGDYVARVGGDEFMLVLPDTRTWEAVEVADRVCRRVGVEVAELPDTLPEVSVSIGVQRLARGITSVTEVVRATQTALKASKSGGKNRVTLQGEESEEPAPSRSLTPVFGSRRERYLVERIGLLTDGELVGWEIRSSTAGGPADALYRHAIKRAALPNVDLAWFRAALRRAPEGTTPIHVQLFPSTLQQVGIRLVDSLPPGFDPTRLRICLDEQFLSGDPYHLRPSMSALRHIGLEVTVEIADFGRTTLEALVLLRPERVRVDRQRIAGVADSVAMRAGLQRFSRVCHALGAGVVATGVVTQADLAVLRDLGIQFGTGTAVRDLVSAPPLPTRVGRAR
jgi:diguanylate cyclase (GGDEF)-like protein